MNHVTRVFIGRKHSLLGVVGSNVLIRHLLIREELADDLVGMVLVQSCLHGVDFALRVDHLLVQPLLRVLVKVLRELLQLRVLRWSTLRACSRLRG